MSRAAWLACALWMLAMPAGALSQVAPNLKWRTLHTAHFRVHFSAGLEPVARAAATHAESAYGRLAAELKPPRGRIDLVVADNRDFANGYATPFPTNRVVVYAVPPVDAPMLRSTHGWLENLIVHELTHIFHLDRVEGVWRGVRLIFGRNPSMMPNSYAPVWLKEGLAVYYESRLTGEGRLFSGEQHMHIRAAAERGRLPAIGEMSIVTSREPEGHTPYIFGARLIEFMANQAGPGRMNEFVGSMSANVIPHMFGYSAKKTLGMSFGRAWRAYGDSILRTYSAASPPLPGWRQLTRSGRTAWYPRWITDDSLIYAGSDGKSTPGLYSLTLDGRVERIARRNSVGVNAPGPDGSIVFAQPDYLDPYTVRYDLYRRTVDGRETRLTRGARLSAPDVRADGEIVAIQASDGTTSVVRVSAGGGEITRLSSQSLEATWADPRWSPDGERIAAIRRDRNGTSSLVLLDTDGKEERVLQARSLQASPAWIDSSRLLLQVDTGRSQLSLVTSRDGGAAAHSITAASTGVMQPAPNPAGMRLAAVEYKFDGYHIGVAPLGLATALSDHLPPIDFRRPTLPAQPAGVTQATSSLAPNEPASQLFSDSIAAREYSAWRYMLPRYWVPLATRALNGRLLLGAATSAYDVIDRHGYSADLFVNTGGGAIDGSVRYSYAGLGVPVIGVSLFQSHDYVQLFGGSPRTRVGFLRERSQAGALSLQFRRPRYRTSASLSVSVDYERLTYGTEPASLLEQLANFNPDARHYLGTSQSIALSNTRRPSLSISPEDGFSLSATVRERWRTSGSESPSLSATGSLRAFKSLDLPGFAHHVLAARVAGGASNSRATSRFSVGGNSGSKLELFPGYDIGDVSRLFPVRGFEAGTVRGLRALAGSIEYRAPLAAPSFGIGLFPLFFDRISLSLFADAGTAWCPARYSDAAICSGVSDSPRTDLIASAGAELNLDAALQYDAPYRLRLGVASIVRKPDDVSSRGTSLYFTLGFPF